MHFRYFQTEKEKVGSTVAQYVGNITNDSEVTFKYGIRNDEGNVNFAGILIVFFFCYI